MSRLLVPALFGLMLFTGAAGAQEGLSRGKIKKVDADKNMLTITTGGKDLEVLVTPQTRLMSQGKGPLKEGLKSAQLKPGSAVVFKTAERDGKAILLGLMLAGPDAGKQGDIRRARVKKLDLEKRTLTLTVGGKDQVYQLTEQTRVLDATGKSLKERLRGFEPGAQIFFKAVRQDGKDVLVGLKLAGREPAALPHVDTSKLKPLTDMGTELYHGHKGGLYPNGKNERPAAHEKAGLALAKQVRPLNADGKPGPDGKIVLLSVGMSNTSQASTGFQRALKDDTDKNPAMIFVNGAVGGMTAAAIQDPDDGQRGTQYWKTVDERLRAAGATRAQVQAIWIKEADARPTEGFPGYAKKLQAELTRIVQMLPTRFPNLKLVYLTSRTYGGYARTLLNPEPYAFESGLSVRWLIEQQLKGDPGLNYDPQKGAVKAPWLSWGPYFWANGAKKRSDGFSYDESDFRGDGTHLSESGIEKVGQLMLRFFKTDTTTRPWFVRRTAR